MSLRSARFQEPLVCLLAVCLAGEATAQRVRRAPFDPSAVRFGTPIAIPAPLPAPYAAGGEVIGYTTDASYPHFYELPDLSMAAADLVADGHTLVPIGPLSTSALEGIDRLVLGLADGFRAWVTSADLDVIEVYVRDGGRVVFLGENNLFFHASNQAVGLRFEILYSDSDPAQNNFTAIHAHPITSGPFGAVELVWSPYNTPVGFGSIETTGPYASSLVDFDNGFSASAVIEPNALAPGSGVFVAFPDVNVFLEDYQVAHNRRLWRNAFAYGGTYTLGFETEDDYVSALVNGQAVASPEEFDRLVSITASGPNLGAAVFDSTPLGPNDPSQDRDLLVGRGSLLILQNSDVPAQGLAGVFDRPNDDQDGGTLTFAFPDPVEPRSVVLVDIDVGTEQASRVTLTDHQERTRVFTVPPRWTEDLLLDGPPGWRTLDLTRPTPQPGFLSTATASETPGFDGRNVVRVTIELGSSGAVDDLTFVRYCGPH